MSKDIQPRFPPAGTHLQRYAGVFNSVEINSSFYRPHKIQVYRRWAASVPGGFRFSVKVPKEITHVIRLIESESLLDRFLEEVQGLGEKLGPLLVQLPPSFGFDEAVAGRFFRSLRERHDGKAAVEPRHTGWFTAEADALLKDSRIARVAADPALSPVAALPGGWSGFVYRRLHGSPRMYYSAYPPEAIEAVSHRMAQEADRMGNGAGDGAGVGETWCVFDNTAEGHAIPDAMGLMESLGIRFPGAALTSSG